jgi:hypothetical protein
MAASQKWSTWMVENGMSKYMFVMKKILAKISPGYGGTARMTRRQFEGLINHEPADKQECLRFFYNHAFKQLNVRNMMEWRVLSRTDIREAEKYIKQYSPKSNICQPKGKKPPCPDGYMLFFNWLCANNMVECYVPFSNIVSRVLMPNSADKKERIEYANFVMKINNMHEKDRVPCYIFLYHRLVRKIVEGSSYWYIDTSTSPETLKSLFYSTFFKDITFVHEPVESIPEILEYADSETDDEAPPLQSIYDDPPSPVMTRRIEYSIADMAYLDGEFA